MTISVFRADAKFSTHLLAGIFVDEMDVARFTVRALSDPRTLNTTLHICPRENRLSQNDLISLWELKTGCKLRREYIPPSAIEDAIKGDSDGEDDLSCKFMCSGGPELEETSFWELGLQAFCCPCVGCYIAFCTTMIN